MATIREELRLADGFSKTFNRYVKLAEKADGNTKELAKATRQAAAQAKIAKAAFTANGAAARAMAQ